MKSFCVFAVALTFALLVIALSVMYSDRAMQPTPKPVPCANTVATTTPQAWEDYVKTLKGPRK